MPSENRAFLKLISPPENLVYPKSTTPPENSAYWKLTVPPENRASGNRHHQDEHRLSWKMQALPGHGSCFLPLIPAVMTRMTVWRTSRLAWKASRLLHGSVLGQDTEVSITVEKHDVAEGLPWDVTVTKNMVPENEAITEFEEVLADLAMGYGGRNDGWGCFSVVSEKSIQ